MKRAICIFCVIVSACNNNRLYEDFVSIPQAQWNQKNMLTFQPSIADTSSVCNVIIQLRHKGNYPYNNLYLFVSVASPSHQVVRDTLQVFLADPSGKWFGKSNLGDLYMMGRMYKKNIRFAEKGIYTFRIEQAMRMRNLPGITDVGVRIEKVK